MKRHLTSRERIVRSYCSVGSRAIDSCNKFLQRFLAWTKSERVLMVYVKLRSVKDLILQGQKKKKKKKTTQSSLKTVSHHRGEIYTSFRLELLVFVKKKKAAPRKLTSPWWMHKKVEKSKAIQALLDGFPSFISTGKLEYLYCIWCLFLCLFVLFHEHCLCRHFTHICKIWNNDLT